MRAGRHPAVNPAEILVTPGSPSRRRRALGVDERRRGRLRLCGWRLFVDGVADVDGSCLDDVGSDAASMDEATECSRCRESFEMGAGFAAALPEAADLADAERFADESVEVDAAGDDVAPSLFRSDGYSVSLEFVERLGFDQGDVLSDAARVGREGSGLVLVAVAVDSARTRSDRGAVSASAAACGAVISATTCPTCV